MASNLFLILVIASCAQQSLQVTESKPETSEEANPYGDIISDVLKEQNAQNLGAAFQTFLERDGANMIGDAISNFGKENAGQILQGLGSLMANQGGKKEGGDGEDTGTNVLEGLGSLMGALQGAGGGGAGDAVAPLLQGLGSLIGGQGGQGGIDPAMIGSMMNMFAQSMEKPRKGKPPKKVNQKRAKNEPKFDMSSLLSIAGSFLEQTKAGGGSDEGNLLTYLPLIAQFIGSFSGPEAERRARQHDDHAWSLPPYLEKWHIIFDHFIHSDMGKYVISALGAEKTFKVFSDGEGRFSYQKFGELMENHSFRRHWIRMVTDRIAGFLQYAADPTVYKTYFSSGHFLLNSYLNSLGFPQTTLFDPARPVETISALANHVAKIYFDFPIQSKEYVQPAVSYVQDLLRLAETSGSTRNIGESKEIADKLADTINLEIIEPLARVNRAYRFTKTTPQCERYVLCLVNRGNRNEGESIPGLKKLLSQMSSLLAGWFLSSETGTSYWTLYTDIVGEMDCQSLYSEKCNDFHVEEMRVTTEYVHNEL